MVKGFSCKDVADHASDHLEGVLPWRVRLQLTVHLAMCQHCRRLVRQMRALTGALALLGTGASAPARPARGRWDWPMRATGVLGGACAVLALLLIPTLAPLEGRVYAHATNAHAQPGVQVPMTELEVVLGTVGAHLRGELPGVVYAHRCRVAGDTAAHLLLRTPDGVVVALLLARRHGEHEFQRGEMYGHFEPFGSGTLAVLARDPDVTRRVAAQLRGTVAWL